MGHATKQRAPVGLRFALAGLGLISGLAMLQPAEIQAAVSGGATIYNQATVTYTTPSIPSKKAWGTITVTVATKANNPFVTVTPTTHSTGETSAVIYNYNIINQSNGTNTLTVTTPLTSTDSPEVGAPGANALITSSFLNLWGGITLGITADNTVTIPHGTLPAANTKVAVKVGLNVYYYTVDGTASTAGTAASTNAVTGNLIPEVNATLILTPVAHAGVAATNLTQLLTGTGATLGAGVIIGEYGETQHDLTTGTLIGLNTTGTHTINITVTANDGTASAAYTTSGANFNQTVTTVLKNPLTVTKAATPPGAKKPSDTITYTVLVTNNTSAATSVATLADPLSAYITYTPGTTTLNGGPVADNGSPPFFPYSGAGININSAGQAAGVILPAASATIVYQVTVN